MEPQSGIRTWQWVVTVIVIIALIVIGFMVFGGKKSTPTTSDTSSTTDMTDTTAGTNRIIMTDQFPGNVVYLSSVQFSDPGYVAIQADAAGAPGKLLGSAHFGAGINSGKITLTTSTKEGGTYYAVMYADDGSGSLDVTKAIPLKDANGNVIMHVFKATAGADAGIKG